MPRLPAGLAVLAPFPFRGLAGLPLGLAPLTRPDRVPRWRRPRGRAVRPQPPLQFRGPQLQLLVPLSLSLQFRPQHRVLGVFGLDHRLQPGDQLTLIPAVGRHTRLIGRSLPARPTRGRREAAGHRLVRGASGRSREAEATTEAVRPEQSRPPSGFRLNRLVIQSRCRVQDPGWLPAGAAWRGGR